MDSGITIPNLRLIRVPCPQCGGTSDHVVSRGRDYEYSTCSNFFTFVRCDYCSLTFLNPRPSLEDFDIIYPANYYSFTEKSRSRKFNPVVQMAWDIIERKRVGLFCELLGDDKKKILDVGCGYGRLLNLLTQYGCPAWQLTGVESGLPKQSVLKGAENAFFYHGYFEDVEFHEAPFDLIIAQQVIEHSFDPVRMLRRTCDLLAPDGYAIFDTPNFDGIDRKLFTRSYWGGYHFPRHLTLFTPSTFRTLAESTGFKVVACKKLLSPVFWVLTLHNIMADIGIPRRYTNKIHYQNLPLILLSTFIELVNWSFLKNNSNMRIILKKTREPVQGCLNE